MTSRLNFNTGPLVTSVKAQVNRALYAAGQEIEVEAEISITSGSISGPGHVPSLPGQPPNADTRQLDTSISTQIVGDLAVDVASEAPYAEALELGTEKMEPRPYMRPALEKKRRAAEALVQAAVNRAAS